MIINVDHITNSVVKSLTQLLFDSWLRICAESSSLSLCRLASYIQFQSVKSYSRSPTAWLGLGHVEIWMEGTCQFGAGDIETDWNLIIQILDLENSVLLAKNTDLECMVLG